MKKLVGKLLCYMKFHNYTKWEHTGCPTWGFNARNCKRCNKCQDSLTS